MVLGRTAHSYLLHRSLNGLREFAFVIVEFQESRGEGLDGGDKSSGFIVFGEDGVEGRGIEASGNFEDFNAFVILAVDAIVQSYTIHLRGRLDELYCLV